MPQIQAAIFARADSHVGLQALIGDPPRLYPVEAKQNTGVPYVTFQIVSGARQHEMSADSLGRPRVQFDCWGKTRQEALDVRDQVIAAFSRWSGTFGGVVVDSSVCVNEGVDVQRDDTTLIPRVTLEFEMAYQL